MYVFAISYKGGVSITIYFELVFVFGALIILYVISLNVKVSFATILIGSVDIIPKSTRYINVIKRNVSIDILAM